MNKIDLIKLISEMDAAADMLAVVARHDAMVREVRQKIVDVSYALGEMATEGE